MQRLLGFFCVCCLTIAACGDGEDTALDAAGDSTEAEGIAIDAGESDTSAASSTSARPEQSSTSATSIVLSVTADADATGGSSADGSDVSTDDAQNAAGARKESTTSEAPATTATSTTTEAPATDPPAIETSVPPPTAAPVTQPVARNLGPQSWVPFASFEDVTLIHPSVRIERIGFHESNHDGARQMVAAEGAVNPLVLESRDRGNGSRTAADIVVEPGTEIRAPVTGTVIRAGGYILYCRHNDDFVVIEPDAHPGWEVKLLHITGVMVSAGDRVEAGVTVVAPGATPLPFDSQVDEFTAEPSWPHVHIELVDPSIPDRPSKGGGC